MKNIISFYKEKQTPPEGLKTSTLAIARCEFHQKEIFTKAFGSLFIGFVLSLIVCPQFGFGVPSGHGISHIFWLIGPWACALFCGVFLYLCGSLSVALVLNRFERYWFMQKTMGVFAILPAFLWVTFMMMPETDYVSVSYTASWALGFVGMWIITKVLWKKMVMTNL